MMKQKIKTEPIKKGDFVGKWRITKMSEWDNKYMDMEVKAYINIEKDGSGDFHFGLVSASINGDFLKERQLFDFTFEGTDEMDPISGDGWMKISYNTATEGEIRFHAGDKSKFWAKKMKIDRKRRKR